MWTELAAFVQANTTESLLITIVGTLLVWLYKQFKDMIDRQQQEKVAALQAKQGLFIRLELTIATVLHQSQGESKRELNQLLGDCGPYLSSMQRQLVRDYYRAFDPAVLRTLHAFIIHEVDNISRQSDQENENQVSREYCRHAVHPQQHLIDSKSPFIIYMFCSPFAKLFQSGDERLATL